MEIHRYPETHIWPALQQRPQMDGTALFQYIEPILLDIRERGDDALHEYTQRFDGYFGETLRVSDREVEEACIQMESDLKEAILTAKAHIEKFHQAQKEPDKIVETMPGVVCRQKSVPIEKVGLYIPGGSAPLFSTVLMLAIPAQIAGCREIILCTPPSSDGNIHPAILYTASLVGVTAIYKLGGVQAIGALAFGTQSVPRVYKIFGPGNQYVTAAKQWVSLHGAAIDLPAGPSEVLVMADESANPAFVAADLLSQAEHGADSQVILLTDCESLLKATAVEINQQLKALPRCATAEKALQHSRLILLRDVKQMVAFSNNYAPEHLILSIRDAERVAEKITQAGSVFLGHYTPESAGDYASGTNHTLPTHGYATAYSGVNLDSFVKKITFQKIEPSALTRLGPIIEKMAEAEQLQAHRYAVTVRLQKLRSTQN